LKELAGECVAENGKIWLAPQASRALSAIVLQLNKSSLLMKNTPTKMLKAVKNDCELECVRNAHVKDGIALSEYLQYLDNTINKSEGANPNEKEEGDVNGEDHGADLTEVSGANMLDGLRAHQEGFVDLSFDTISGSGPNGAVIHYSPSLQTDRRLCGEELYLVDSGGQYWDGTTDVTRTVALCSSPPPKQIECYTRVLKGHIALAEMVIPEGTQGHRIDSCARAALWQVGLDYLHGTGHGVGMFLNVHEGPQGISYRTNAHQEGIKENMILSNEPGYYEAGQFGIRIESLIVYKKFLTKYSVDDKKFLKPETITYVPLDRKLIDKSMLSELEINWINDYHQLCWNKLTPLASQLGKTELIEWLKTQTQPL